MVNNVDFNSNPRKAFWQFTTPLLLLTLFEAGYSFVDVFWVSQMNAESFFAIGVAVPLVTLIISFGKSIGIGTNSIMSRQIGDNDFTDTYNSILHGIAACLLIGFIVIISTFFLEDILTYMGATSSMELSNSNILMSICLYLFQFLCKHTAGRRKLKNSYQITYSNKRPEFNFGSYFHIRFRVGS